MLAACARLTHHLKRSKGETAKEFFTRWEKKVREKSVTLPDDYMGVLLGRRPCR